MRSKGKGRFQNRSRTSACGPAKFGCGQRAWLGQTLLVKPSRLRQRADKGSVP
jgi:hypothetical protein